MTGLSVLRHAYGLMEQPGRLTAEDGNERGLTAVNQIYSDLWRREHTEAFEPLTHLRQTLDLSWQYLPAMTYGVAALLCLNEEEEGPYNRYLDLYLRALPRTGGTPYRRADVLFTEGAV
ncbi:MAG: hypothetical protein E7527_04165 [Ruminococcaceae bacterium]|nr:hypothetical protein [Oscillospiraceae bacterium]